MKVHVALGCGRSRYGWFFSVIVVLFSLLLMGVHSASASSEVTVFGPQRFERQQGAPTVYTETFRGCRSAGQARLQLWNGEDKATRITAAEVWLNGREVFAENDFKNAESYLERQVAIRAVNELKIILKSGDYKKPAFLRIVVSAPPCDITPPTIFNLTPADGSRLDTPRPLIAASYRDGSGDHEGDHDHDDGDSDRHDDGDDHHDSDDHDGDSDDGAAANGIDPASIRLTLDGRDVTAAATFNSSSLRYLPTVDLVDGLHTVTLNVADRSGNLASSSWSFSTDVTPPQLTVTAPADGSTLNTPTITISGTIDDPGTQVTINAQLATVNGMTFSLVGFLLNEGANLLTVQGIDAWGRGTTLSLHLLLDTIPPVITVISPVDQSISDVLDVQISGTLSEVATLLINDQPVIVSGTTFSTPLTLTPGLNTLQLVAIDSAGNRGTVTLTVQADGTPPVVTLTSPPDRLITNAPQLTISGTLSEVATLELNGLSFPSSGLSFTTTYTLLEGENPLTITAVDAAGNVGSVSTVVTLDTIAPQIVVSAPLSGSIGNQRTVIVSGTLDDPGATLTLNNQPVTLANEAFSHAVELQLGSNTLTLSAVDLAGNRSTTTVLVELDDVLPVVTLTSPPDGLLTSAAQVTISGQISENDCTITLGGLPLSVTGESFSGSIELLEGENPLTLTAIDRAGNRGSASLTITSDRTGPTLGIVAPLSAVAGETLRLQISANDASGLTLVETSAAGRPFAALATPASPLEESLAYTFSPDLAPGTTLLFALRALDGAGNSAIATTTVTISAGPSGPGYLQGEVYDDASGLRLAGVTVRVRSAGTNHEVVTAEDGAYLFELPAGDYGIELSLAGYTSNFRAVSVRPEQTLTVLDARLTQLAAAVPVGDNGRLLTAPLEAGPIWKGTNGATLTVALSQGALSESLDARLTPLSSQGLPVPLPRGWSPLAALDLRFTAAGLPLPEELLFFYPATLRLPLGESALVAGDELTVARFDQASKRWLAQTTALVNSDATAAVTSLNREGIYSLILADPAPCTPPSPVNGDVLAATTAAIDELKGWLVEGEVAPAAAPPSLGLRAVGEVRIAPGSELPAETALASGLLLRGRVTESFNLFSGEVVQPSDYVQDLLLFRAPCLSGAGAGRIAPPLADGLRASFPVTPSHQYTIAELLQGEVGVSIVPAETQSSGVLAGPEGALLLSSDGIGLTLPAGALEKTVPVQLQSLAASAVAPLIPSGFTLVQAVRIDLSRQTLQSGALLSLPLPTGFDSSRPVVLAQLFTAGGGERLRGVAWLRPIGSLLTSVNSVAGVSLPGIRSGGTYCILQSESPLGLVRGTVRNSSNQPFSAALVTTASPGLADLSTTSGSYLLFTAIGTIEVSALDLTRFDRGASSGSLLASESVITLDPIIRATVPSVVTLSPADGATGVEPTTRISITFSEPIERSSITAATIALNASDNTPVSGVFSFSPDATTISFYPEARLISEGIYHLTIAGSVRDLQGYTLAAPVTATFTVRDTTPPALPPAGSITATFPDSEGMIDVIASRGSAEYDATILIINDTSGEIVSIAAQSDGSFSTRIHGQLGDEIQIVMIDPAGNQTLISYLTFSAPDGRTLVTAKGGKVSGEGDLLLDIPAGALVGPAVVKITPVMESELPHPVPAEARFLGAVRIDSGNIPFSQEVKLSIPLPADFPANAFPFLAQPVIHTNPDGSTEEVYQLIDTVKIVDGRLTTASPPFSGVTGFGIFTFLYFPSPAIGPVVVSGISYRDLNGQPGYQPNPDNGREVPTTSLSGELTYNYDQPISGAVIRSPGGYNFIAYSDQSGHYAAFGFSVAELCRPFSVTAIHPQTMFRHTANLTACDAPYIVNNLNFKLADKSTTIPDKTQPVVSLNIKVVADQPGDPHLIAGTIPVGTALEVSVSAIDQDLAAATLGVKFHPQDSSPARPGVAATLSPGVKELYAPMAGETPALYRTPYTVSFATIPVGRIFRPDQPGVYILTVDAEDNSGNVSSRSVQVRALDQSAIPGSNDGVPVVDASLPGQGALDVMVTAPVVIWFSEPVENVDATTFTLTDLTTNALVPATVYATFTGGWMQATLTPKGNLSYARSYRATLSSAITDTMANAGAPAANDGKLPLAETTIDFTTKVPRAFDLEAESFSGSRDIDLYTSDDGHTYAYVAAGINGWRVIDVTDPTQPQVKTNVNFTAAGRSFRGVSVEKENSVLGLTEDIRPLSGDQFGYVRFYDLAADPVAPPKIAQEKLAEAFSGVPTRLDLAGKYAYIATINAGIQVVDIEAAKAHTGQSDGTTIVGGYDSIGQGYGHPNDVQVYTPDRLLVTTNSGYLLLLSVAVPELPTLTSHWRPDPSGVIRAAAVGGFQYNGPDGTPQILDLAVAGLRDGRLVTLDLSDPYAPNLLGTVVNDQGEPVSTLVSDISINREAGLAFVTTINSIQVFDLKVPTQPRLLATIAALPDADGNLLPLGNIPTLVEQGGWVYLGSDSQGLRVLDLDPSLLKVVDANGNELGASDEFRFGNGSNPQKLYAIEMLTDGDNTLCSDDNYSGDVSVLDKDGNIVASQNYRLSFAPKVGSKIRCNVTVKDSGAGAWQRFVVSNGTPNLTAGTLKLTGGLGNRIRVHVTARLENETKEKYFSAPIEPVGVIVLAIDGLRQDVLYGAGERAYDDPNGCGTGQRCYVDPATLPGLSQILNPETTVKLPGVTAIFPSITLASWASIFSGKLPNETGIMGNEFFARDLYELNDAVQPNDKLSVGVPAYFGNPKGLVSFDGGAFKGFEAYPKTMFLGDQGFFIPGKWPLQTWKTPASKDWIMPLRVKHDPGQAQSDWAQWTPQNDPRIYKPKTLFEELRDHDGVKRYFSAKGGDPVVVEYNHYARGAYWLTWDTELASNSSRILDQASWGMMEDYLQGNYRTVPGFRNSTPFSALTVWYLPGLDHEAHIAGIGTYREYFKTVIDDKIKQFVEELKYIDEFNNKIFIIVADHGHTAMPESSTMTLLQKKYDENGAILNQKIWQGDTSCEVKLKGLEEDKIKYPEMANNNLHIFELAQVMAIFGKKVLAPQELLKAGKEVKKGMTTIMNQADIIAALNGPMAHIYVKGTGGWGSVPNEGLVLDAVEIFWSFFINGAAQPEKQRQIVNKLLSSIEKILVWDNTLGHYKVIEGFEVDGTPIVGDISSEQVFPPDEYISAFERIDGLRTTGKDNRRSGDIVLLMKDKTTGEISQRYTTGAACKSWHGSLNPSDSYVPLIISYPGGIKQLVEEQKSRACGASGCQANWKLGDIVKTIIDTQYR